MKTTGQPQQPVRPHPPAGMLTVAEVEREQRQAERTKWLHAYGVCGDVRYRDAHRQELDDSRRLSQQMHVNDAAPPHLNVQAQQLHANRVRLAHMTASNPIVSSAASDVFVPHRTTINSSTPIKSGGPPATNTTSNGARPINSGHHSTGDGDGADAGHLGRQQQRELEQLQRKKESQRQIALKAMQMAEVRRQQPSIRCTMAVPAAAVPSQTVECKQHHQHHQQYQHRSPTVPLSMSEQRIKSENMRRVKMARIRQHMLEMQANGMSKYGSSMLTAASTVVAPPPPPATEQSCRDDNTVWLAASVAARKLEFDGPTEAATVDTVDTVTQCHRNPHSVQKLMINKTMPINNWENLIIRYDRAELLRLQSVLMMPNVPNASCWAPSAEMMRRWPQLFRVTSVRSARYVRDWSNNASVTVSV